MIPTQIQVDINFLYASIQNLAPIEAATVPQKKALVTAANYIVGEIQTAMVAAAGGLDGPDPTGYPGAFAAVLLGLAVSANDQSALSDMGGTMGRAAFNMGQI